MASFLSGTAHQFFKIDTTSFAKGKIIVQYGKMEEWDLPIFLFCMGFLFIVFLRQYCHLLNFINPIKDYPIFLFFEFENDSVILIGNSICCGVGLNI